MIRFRCWALLGALGLLVVAGSMAVAQDSSGCSGTLELADAPSTANSAFVQFPDNGVPGTLHLTGSSGFAASAPPYQSGPGKGINGLDEDKPFGPYVLSFDQGGTLTNGVVSYGFPDGHTQGPTPIGNLVVSGSGCSGTASGSPGGSATDSTTPSSGSGDGGAGGGAASSASQSGSGAAGAGGSEAGASSGQGSVHSSSSSSAGSGAAPRNEPAFGILAAVGGVALAGFALRRRLR